MRRYLITALLAVIALATTGGSAQAVVLKNLGVGEVGVSPVPGTTLPAGNVDASAAPCTDPTLAAQGFAWTGGSHPLCWRGGSTIHSNQTFALTWDANRRHWSGTRGYLEQLLADVAKGSGTLGSPYAVATQYTDASGRAQNASKFGGGCIDYGNSTTGADTTCQFGSSVQTSPGDPYPSAGGCAPTGTSSLIASDAANDVCLTDSQIQQEIQSVVQNENILGHTQPGYTPVVVLLLPAQVESCLDGAATVCSANSNATAKFCSYHGQTQVNSQTVDYVVQPWTIYHGCDATEIPPLPLNPSPADLSNDAGLRLASPLSQGQIAAMVNPGLDGWVAADGSEISDNGCGLPDYKVDKDPVGGGSYVLHRAFNNAAAIATDPYTYFGCAPGVALNASFVVPSAVNQGDVVVLDGSSTPSTLLIPNGSYHWDFGDGQTATGPSVAHSYSKGGSYTVKLTVTDRGANQASLSQTITVLGPDGNPVQTPTGGGTGQPGGGGQSGGQSPGGGSQSHLQARLMLMPQAFKAVLRHGVALRLSSNEAADGFASITITRALAKRAGIKAGHQAVVIIGRGTLSRIKNGTVRLHLALARDVAAKLGRLRHATLTIRVVLTAVGGNRVALVEAGRY